METLYEKFIEIFGEYEPVVTEFTDGSSITDTNWGYILSVVIFIVFMFCCLKVLGSMICKDR